MGQIKNIKLHIVTDIKTRCQVTRDVFGRHNEMGRQIRHDVMDSTHTSSRNGRFRIGIYC